MDNYFSTLFERLGNYTTRENELVETIEKAQIELNAIKTVRDKFVNYVSSEIAFTKDSELEKKFQSIISLKAENKSMNGANSTGNQNVLRLGMELEDDNDEQESGDKFNKTHFVLKQFAGSEEKGLRPVTVVESVEKSIHGDKYAQNHVYNILRKLRERGLLIKQDENYVLTNKGIEFLQKDIKI